MGIFWLGCGAVIPAGLWLSPGLAAASPRLAIGETTHDFGTVFEDRALTHTFTIRNTGDAPLKIEDVDSDCACTASKHDPSIPPGSQGEITLTIAPYSVIHRFEKKSKIRFNDPEHEEVVLTLKGVSQPFIEIQPSHVVRLRGAPGENLKGQVRFISHLPDPWQITEYRTNIPDKIEVAIRAEEPNRVYVVEVRNKNTAAGPYNGLVELFTTSKERPRMIVRVFGELYLPSAGSP